MDYPFQGVQADAVSFVKRKAIGLRLVCVTRMGLIVKAFRLIGIL
jgi:hypothetical protein